MKIGILSDIHNNLPALEVALRFFDKEKCDGILCAGDIIGIGPYPEETVQRIRKLKNVTTVRGNHERYLTDGLDSAPSMHESERQYHLWEHGRLSKESKAYIESLPYSVRLLLDGISVLVLHYCMDEKNRYVHFKPRPTPEDCACLFAGIDADVIIFGHTHNALCCGDGRKLYINSGSLGCPSKSRNLASCGILSTSGGKASYEGFSLPYDSDAVVAEIERLQFPACGEIKTIFYGRAAV